MKKSLLLIGFIFFCIKHSYSQNNDTPCENVITYNLLLEELNPIQTTDFIGGWNMFGFPCQEAKNTITVFENIVDEVVIVKDNTGSVYIPEFGFNGIGNLLPLGGYQIKLTEAIDNFTFCNGIVMPIIEGCMNCEAFNFNPYATVDNNTCDFESYEYYDCYGHCIEDTDNDGVCDSLEIYGCTNADACNYDVESTEYLNVCLWPVVGYDCVGDSLSGCDDYLACNYEPQALIFENCDYSCDSDASCYDWNTYTFNTQEELDNFTFTCEHVQRVNVTGSVYDVSLLNQFSSIRNLIISDNDVITTIELVNLENCTILEIQNCVSLDTISITNLNMLMDFSVYGCLNLRVLSANDIITLHTFSVVGSSFGLPNLEINLESLVQLNSIFLSTSISDLDFLSNIDPGYIGIFNFAAWSNAHIGVIQNPNLNNCTSICPFLPIYSFSVFNNGDLCSSIDSIEYVCNNLCDEELIYDCNGVCFQDEDGDGVCNDLETYGCDDVYSCNYDTTATELYCEYPMEGQDCYGNSCPEGDVTISSQEDLDEYNLLYPHCTYISGDLKISNTEITTIDSLYKVEFITEYLGLLSNTNCFLLQDFTSLMLVNHIILDGYCGEFIIPSNEFSYSSISTFSIDYLSTISNESFENLCSVANLEYSTYSNGSENISGDLFCSSTLGCFESTACNYNDQATIPNNLCTYPDEGYYCDGICIDIDGDQVCDIDEAEGCTNVLACNYNPFILIDDGSCVYVNFICDSCVDGVVVSDDSDDDGVCDSLEIYGCTDLNACNFDPTATEENGLCEYAVPGLNCNGDVVILQIGEVVHGGIVFYIDETGEHGLVSSLENITEGSNMGSFGTPEGFEWGCFESAVSGADGTSIGSGYQNTQDIVAQNCQTQQGGVAAAQACFDYESGGYTDWYLPSKDELMEMCTVIEISNYWSSSEYSNSSAWFVGYNDLGTYTKAKDNSVRVRAIRSF